MSRSKEMMVQAIDNLVRSVGESPVIEKGQYRYFVHPLTDGIPSISPALLEDAVDCIVALLPDPVHYSLFLTAEAMGIPLTTGVSIRVGKPFSIVRKRTYGLSGEVAVQHTTGYSTGTMAFDLPGRGGRLVIIDDVLSTGGTLRALREGATRAGWEVVSAIVLFDKLLEGRPGLERELGFPIQTLIGVEVEVEGCRAFPLEGIGPKG